MTPPEQAEALAILEAVDADHPATPRGERFGTSSLAEFELRSGWRVLVYTKYGDWGYVEGLIAPDGRRWGPYELTSLVEAWQPHDWLGWPGCEELDGRASDTRSHLAALAELAARSDSDGRAATEALRTLIARARGGDAAAKLEIEARFADHPERWKY